MQKKPQHDLDNIPEGHSFSGGEDLRLATLQEYQILDTPPEEYFDEITKTASLVCDSAVSFICFIDADRLWFKSRYGTEKTQMPRQGSYCGDAIESDELFIASDLVKDTQQGDRLLTWEGTPIRFYAGAPLIAPNGARLGTLCVIDSSPHTLNEAQKQVLKTLSKQVITYLEKVKRIKEMQTIRKEQATRLREIEFYKNCLDTHAIIVHTDAKGVINYANDKFCEISQYSREELIGKTHRIINSGMHSKEFFASMWSSISSGKTWRGEIRNLAKDGSFYWVDSIIFPVISSEGKIIEYIAFRYDITEKKEAAILYGETQKIAKIGGAIFNVDSGKLTWTDEAYEICELDKPTPINAEMGMQYFSENDRPLVANMVTKCIEQGVQIESDFEITTDKGNKKWVKLKAIPEYNIKGKVARIIGTFQDITFQKRLENTLKQQHSQLEEAQAIAKIGSWKCEFETEKSSWSKQMYSIFPANIGKGQPSFELYKSYFKDEEYQSFQQAINNVLKIDKPFKKLIQLKGIRGQEETTWVEITGRAIKNSNGDITAIFGTCQDITDRVIQEKQLALILESHQMGVWRYNPVTNNLRWDQSMFDLFEIESSKFTNTYEAWLNALHPADRESAPKNFEAALAGSGNFESIFKIVTKNGKTKHIGAKGVIERDQDGKAIFVTGVNWDRSHEQQAIDEMNKQMKIAQHHAKLASIGELAAGVGHEINNPLAIVKGYLYNIEKQLAHYPTEHYKDLKGYLERINIAADRIANIVKGLRTFSRADLIEDKDFNPIAALTESYKMVQPIYEKDGITVRFDVKDKDAILIKGNTGKFQQVIMNLLANARDAVQGTALKSIEISGNILGNEFTITIKDSGNGIPRNHINKIFDPFFTTKEVNKGTGIGLSIVHNYISELNGSIKVKSKEGEGSTFTLRFPIQSANLTAPDVKANDQFETEDIRFSANAIIADDEEGIRDVLCDLLEDLGLKVFPVENGKKALELYTRNPNKYDLIISDIKMPEMDGLTLIQTIRSNKTIDQPKFIVITGGMNIDLDDKTEEIANLIDGYFYKPFEDREIFKALKNCLQGSYSGKVKNKVA